MVYYHIIRQIPFRSSRCPIGHRRSGAAATCLVRGEVPCLATTGRRFTLPGSTEEEQTRTRVKIIKIRHCIVSNGSRVASTTNDLKRILHLANTSLLDIHTAKESAHPRMLDFEQRRGGHLWRRKYTGFRLLSFGSNIYLHFQCCVAKTSFLIKFIESCCLNILKYKG